MNDWSTLKKLIWLRIIKGGGSALRTVTGALIHVTNALALPAEALTVNVEPIQAGSGDPSPDNVRPISGRTSATVTRTGKNLCPINTLDDVEWATENNDLLTFINGLANGTYNMAFKSTIKTLTDDTGYWVTGFVFTSPSEFINNQASTNAAHSVGSVQTKNVSFVINDNNRGKFTHAYIYGAGNNQVGKTGTATITEIQVELGSTASSYDPYAGNTYTIQLGDTVYGGQLDVTGGKMVVDRAMVDLGTLNWAYNTTYVFFITQSLIDRKIGVTNMVSDLFKTESGSWSGTPKTNAIWGNGSNTTVYVQYPLTAVEDFLALVTGHQLVYELATPFEITLTPQQIDMLLGTNNLWADAGDLTLTYYADGNASTSEALGILLGGTYNNPGGADDVSDDEALEILLGGS